MNSKALISACLLLFCAGLSAKPKLPEIQFEWDAPVILGSGGYVRVHRLNDSRLMCTFTRGGNSYACYSTDNGFSWSTPGQIIAKFPWSNTEASTTVGIHNPETLQLSADNPHHPGRIFCAVNLRPDGKKSTVHPYGIAYAFSDDNGNSWSELRTVFLSDPWDKDISKGCWEPFLLELPNGMLQIYYSDETPYYREGNKYQNISVLESADGGESWTGPRIVCYTPRFRDGMPVAMIHGDNIYVSIESNNVGVRLRPEVVYCSIADNWKETVGEFSDHRFSPFLTSLDSPDFTTGAPYLIQTENFFVISYQSSENADIKISRQRVMEVQACPKREMKKDKFTTMRGASHPLDINPQMESVMWNSLFALGGDEILACCQYNGKVALVRGRVRLR